MHQPVLCGWVGSGAYKLGEQVLSILLVKITVAFNERNLYSSQNPCIPPTTLTQTYYQAKMRWWRCCKSSPSILEYKLNDPTLFHLPALWLIIPTIARDWYTKKLVSSKNLMSCKDLVWASVRKFSLLFMHNGLGQAWRAWFLDGWKMELSDWSRVMQNGTAIKRQKHTK